jgi:hypothetical protein
VLTVSLPKAGTATVNLMSQLPGVAPGHALGSTPPAAIELMGIWRLIEQAAPANLATLKGYALQSLLWMLTPSHQINLTHAVQQPLVTPSFQALVPIRSLGNTYADFIARVNADGQSTSQLDFDSTWTEPYDNPSDPLSLHPDIDRKSGHAAAFQLQLRFPGPLAGPFAVASPVPIQDESGNVLGQYNTAAQTVTFGSTSPTGGVINLRRQEFHDTKYRRVGYTPIATTRFREFFTLPITATLNPYIRQAASPTVIDIPSTARPAAPNILYVIPTFRHTETATGAARQGGFRVYMDRPWFSSGDGELLAAVMWNPTYVTVGIAGAETTKPGQPTTVKPSSVVPTTYQATLPDKFKPYVTMWGADPMFTSLAPVVTPAPSYFTNQAVTTGFNTTSLTLEELPGETVSIAAHNVAFDPVRNLWYCDIDINPVAMYMPFVRLGLARYQPHSVPGAELSKVVLSEFVQLTPTRAASLTPFKDPHFLQVAVSGFSYSSSQSFVDQVITGTSLVVVSLEARSSTDPADDVAWIPLPQYDVTLPFAVTNSGANLWKGSFKLPPAVSGTQYRLVFREYELLNASSTALPAFNPETNFELGYRRLVFAETVDITSIMPTS